MPSRFSRGDWESTLGRWTEHGLITEESAAAIRVWESERAARSSASRLVDALSYLGVSIVLASVLLAVGMIESSDVWTIILPLGMGLAVLWLARLSWRFDYRALADGFAACTVVLLAVALGFGLDRVGGDRDQYEIGFALICLCVLIVGAAMMRLVRSRLATFLAALALALLPYAVVVDDSALQVLIFSGTSSWLDGWELWGTFAAVIAVGIVAQIAMLHPSYLLDADAAPWARLGASLATGMAILWLAGSTPEHAFDWMSLLAGWLITALAFRRNRLELLPASALLLLGSLAGGLSDVDADLRLSLVIVALFTALQITLLGMASPATLGPLANHWLMPFWQGALLCGGVVAGSLLALESETLAAIGMVWGLALLVAGSVRRQRLELLFGAVAVYATGLSLILGHLESNLVAVGGTLVFGLVIVVGAIIWRRRQRGLTLIEADS